MKLQESLNNYLLPGQDFFGPSEEQQQQANLLEASRKREDVGFSVSNEGEAATLPEGITMHFIVERAQDFSIELERKGFEKALIVEAVLAFLKVLAPDLKVVSYTEAHLVSIPFMDHSGVDVYQDPSLFD